MVGVVTVAFLQAHPRIGTLGADIQLLKGLEKGGLDFLGAHEREALGYKIFSINKSLATYRFHKNNLSNIKIKLFTKELSKWLKANKKKFISYNLTKFRFYILKLKLKKNLLL